MISLSHQSSASATIQLSAILLTMKPIQIAISYIKLIFHSCLWFCGCFCWHITTIYGVEPLFENFNGVQRKNSIAYNVSGQLFADTCTLKLSNFFNYYIVDTVNNENQYISYRSKFADKEASIIQSCHENVLVN